MSWALVTALGISATSLQAQAPAASAYEEAVAARLRGDLQTAVRLLQPIVAADPDNSDAQVQLGYALLGLGRYDEAEGAFSAALRVAPGYTDASEGLARIARDRPLAWSLDLDGNYGFIEGPQPDWQEGSIQLRRTFSPATSGSARVEVARRFGRTDAYGEVGVDRALSQRARVYLTIGGTPDADFRPRYQIGAGGSLRISDGGNATVLTLDGRHASFNSGDVQTLSPGVEQYLAGGRAWVTARWINLFDEQGDHQSGYLLRGDVMATDRLRLFAGTSDAPDTSEGIVVDTRSFFGGASYALSNRTAVRVSIAYEDRETGPDRTQIGLGLGLRF